MENPTPSRSEEDPGGVQISHSKMHPRLLGLNDLNKPPVTQEFYERLDDANLRWEEVQENKKKGDLFAKMQALHGTDEEAARKAVIKEIAETDSWFLSQLSSNMSNNEAPLVNKMQIEKKEWELYVTCVKRLISHQGKPFNLTSLVDLEIDLRNHSKREMIVEPFFEECGKRSKRRKRR